MKDALKEYGDAFEAYHIAMKKKHEATIEVEKTRYKLYKAREVLRDKERELIENEVEPIIIKKK